jgi:Carboxypeptidase regulatory-like domain
MKRRYYYVLIVLFLAFLAYALWPRRREPVPEPGAGIPQKAGAPVAAATREGAARETPPPAAPAPAAAAPAPARPRAPAAAQQAEAVPAAPSTPSAAAPPAAPSAPSAAAPPAAPPAAPAPAQVGPPSGSPGQVVGRVVTEEGSPVTRFTLNGTAMSDPGGAFRLTAPRSGNVKMVVRSEGNATALARAKGVSGEVPVPDIVVNPGVAVVGEVLDADTQIPVVEAHATLASIEDVEAALATDEELARLVEPAATGSGGMFLLEHVPRGRYLLFVAHPKYRTELVEVDTNAQRADLTLKRGGTISGKVLGAGGQPVAGRRVVAVSRSALDAREGKTDASGRFQLGPLRPGHYLVHASSADASQPLGSRAVEVAEGKAAEADFRVRAGGTTVRVHIVDERGALAAGEALLAPGDVPLPESFAGLAESAPLLPAAGHGDPQVIPHVPPGAYTLFVLRDGLPGPAFVREALEVKEGADVSIEVKVQDRASMTGPCLPGFALAALR